MTGEAAVRKTCSLTNGWPLTAATRTDAASAAGPSAAVTNRRGSSPEARAAAHAAAATSVSPESSPHPTTVMPRMDEIQSRLGDTRDVAVSIDELVVADPPELWAGLGFRVEGDSCD